MLNSARLTSIPLPKGWLRDVRMAVVGLKRAAQRRGRALHLGTDASLEAAELAVTRAPLSMAHVGGSSSRDLHRPNETRFAPGRSREARHVGGQWTMLWIVS